MTSAREVAEKNHWAVRVSVNGDEVLCIESNMLSGIPDIEKHADIVRTCAEHLLAFIGPEDAEPFIVDDDEEPIATAIRSRSDTRPVEDA